MGADWTELAKQGPTIAVLVAIVGALMTGRLVPGRFYEAEKVRADTADTALHASNETMREVIAAIKERNESDDTRHDQLLALFTSILNARQ